MTEKNVVTAIHDTLHDEMAADDRVVVLGEDIATRGGVFRVTQGFLDEFGEQRVIDTPLAEAGIIGIAVGMALHGLLPVAEIEFADFIHPAFDQMVSEVSRMRYRTNGDFGLPMVVRAPWGGGVHGALYHSQSIEAFYGHIPGLKVVVPGTPYDASGMLRAAIKDPDPVLFLEHKRTYRLIKGEVPDEPFEVPIGKADVKREGDHLSAIAYGLSLHLCLEAASRLQDEHGISVEVVDVRTISRSTRRRSSPRCRSRQGDGRLRGQPHVRRRRRDRRDDRRGSHVRPRRADRSDRRSRCAGHGLREQPRARVHAQRRRGGRSDARARALLAGTRAGGARSGVAIEGAG